MPASALLYRKLYERRHCHSVEVYDGEALVGGLYGVSLGRAFFGESMFHRARDASKVALVHLVARLRAGGFRLLDTQFVTDHLKTFGAVEVPRRQYHKLLEARSAAKAISARSALKRPVTGAQALAQLKRELTRAATRRLESDRRGCCCCGAAASLRRGCGAAAAAAAAALRGAAAGAGGCGRLLGGDRRAPYSR